MQERRLGSGGVQAGTFTLTLRSRSQPASPSPPGVQSSSSLPFLPPCLSSFPASHFPPGPCSPAASPPSPCSARPREPISVGGGRRPEPRIRVLGRFRAGAAGPAGFSSSRFSCSRLSLNSGQFPGLSFLSRSILFLSTFLASLSCRVIHSLLLHFFLSSSPILPSLTPAPSIPFL